MLQTHLPAIFSVNVFILMRFRPSRLIRYVCVFLLTHFQERFQIDAFSVKTLSVLVWMEGLNASKCMCFQMLTHWCGQGLNQKPSLHLITLESIYTIWFCLKNTTECCKFQIYLTQLTEIRLTTTTDNSRVFRLIWDHVIKMLSVVVSIHLIVTL